ncbi:MAG: hypothetical protein IT342_18580 [Candidatus Melainabacteria bacterium]|nr:hypothetical protein [Candidatus Melainabacteria bacterium]
MSMFPQKPKFEVSVATQGIDRDNHLIAKQIRASPVEEELAKSKDIEPARQIQPENEMGHSMSESQIHSSLPAVKGGLDEDGNGNALET